MNFPCLVVCCIKEKSDVLYTIFFLNISYIDRADLDMVHQDERPSKYTKVTSEPMGAYVWSEVLHFDRLNLRLKLKPSKKSYAVLGLK